MRCAVAAVLALVACKGDSKPTHADETKRDIERLHVQRIAHEGFPMWSLKQANVPCPASLAEVAAVLDVPTKDAWGRELAWFCGTNLPAGASPFGVQSAGPDGEQGTDDDVRSWIPTP